MKGLFCVHGESETLSPFFGVAFVGQSESGASKLPSIIVVCTYSPGFNPGLYFGTHSA